MDTNTTTLCKFSPLRELVIRISFRLDDTLRGFPFLPTLTSLELDLQSLATEVVDLDPILKTCPLLEALSVKAAAVTGHWMVWTILDQKKLQEHRPHLALRSLVLKNIGFPQDHLENVLLFTPHLKVLKLLSMDWNSDLKHDWTRLMNHIKALGIALTAVDFSLYDPNNCHFPEPPLPMSSSSCPELAPRMHEICPLTTDWIFHAAKVTPMFLKTLSLRTTFVTSMELYWRNRSNYSTGQCCKNDLKDAPRLVHEYLCTSPQLVHLQTLKAPIRPEYMDLFGRGVGSGGDGYNTATKRQSTVMPSPHPAIWMCRSLKTLDIEIHGKSNPRVLFGYISRVLPHLEQLNIARPAVCESESGALIYATIDLHLRDGLCLLSRLRCLERLCIEPIRNGADMALTCTMMDLSWLLSSSSTSVENDSSSAEFKAQRKEEVERWDMQRGMEEYRESTRPPGSLEMMMPPAGTRQEDREIWHQLRHLGMYLDVEEMVHEMDSDGFKSLPSLYQLSLGSFYPQRPEVELDYVLSGKVL
ncbi:hypothetical protein EC991_002924 [Linnemannia zychae]|nr:hypothetical protein EC991_002924 [Linnemannia zychae]